MSALRPDSESPQNNQFRQAPSPGQPARDFDLGEIPSSRDELDCVEAPTEAYVRDLGEIPVKLSSMEIAAIERQALRELDVLTEHERQLDFLIDTVLDNEEPLEVACLLSNASDDLVVNVAEEVLASSRLNFFDADTTSFKNVALLCDELRTQGARTLVDSLNIMLTEEAKKVKDAALHGVALLEVFDFYFESGQTTTAVRHLVEALHLLRECDSNLQTPALPRVQNIIDHFESDSLADSPEGEVRKEFFEQALDRILREVDDPLNGEVLETRMSRIRNTLEEQQPGSDELNKLEFALYDLCSDVQGEAGLEDLYGEALEMLGDVMNGLRNREGALGCYMNAIELFERTGDVSDLRLNSALQSARRKAIPLLRRFKDPRLKDLQRLTGVE
jgi:GAF domain-containing protein